MSNNNLVRNEKKIMPKLITLFFAVIIGLPEAAMNEYSIGLFYFNGVPIFYVDLLIVLLISFAVLSCFITNTIKYKKIFLLIAIILCLQIIPIVMGIYNGNRILDILADFRGTLYILLIWAWAQLTGSNKSYMGIVSNAILIGTMVYSISIIYMFIFSIDSIHFVSGRISYRNLLVLVLATFISWRNILSKKLILFNLLIIILSFSMNFLGGFRSLLVLQIIGIILITLISSLRIRKDIIFQTKFLKQFLLYSTMFFFIILLVEPIRDKFIGIFLRIVNLIFQPNSDYSAFTRIEDIKTTLSFLKGNYIFGSGYGTRFILSTTGSDNLFIDNLYFTLLSKMGVIIFPFFILLMLILLLIIMKKNSQNDIFVTIATLLFIIGPLHSSGIWYTHAYPFALYLYISELAIMKFHLTSK